MITAILIIEGVAGLLTFVACLIIQIKSRPGNDEKDRAVIEEKERRRAELLERLSAAYHKARRERVHNFYLLAVSHCCWTLRNGGEIDENAALLALRGLEGDESLDNRVDTILRERRKSRRAGE